MFKKNILLHRRCNCPKKVNSETSKASKIAMNSLIMKTTIEKGRFSLPFFYLIKFGGVFPSRAIAIFSAASFAIFALVSAVAEPICGSVTT